MYACGNGHIPTIELLLDRGANFDHEDYYVREIGKYDHFYIRWT